MIYDSQEGVPMLQQKTEKPTWNEINMHGFSEERGEDHAKYVTLINYAVSKNNRTTL